MRKINRIFDMALIILFIVLTHNCENINNSDIEGQIPEIVTCPIYSITKNAACSGGEITSDGGISLIAHGVCWSISNNPTINDNKTIHEDIDKISGREGLGFFRSNLTGLSPYITYYARAYATNSKGTGYGNEISFTTLPVTVETSSVTYNNHKYLTVKIGSQWWFAENLQTTHFNDGNEIPYLRPGTSLEDSEKWRTTTSPAFGFIVNLPRSYLGEFLTFKNIYGPLYNWYSVNTGMLCPSGWHVPTDADWIKLTDYLINNGYEYQNNPLMIAKSLAATTGWNHWTKHGTPGNDPSSNNKSGFSAYPSGYIDDIGRSQGRGGFTYFWSANEYSLNKAGFCSLTYSLEYSGVQEGSSHSQDKNSGFCVRCVKD